MKDIRRRDLLAGAVGSVALGAFGSSLLAPRANAGVRPLWPGPAIPTTDVQWISGYDTTAYVAYMHQNGFYDGDHYFVYRKALTLGGPNLLHVYDTVSDTSFRIPDRAPDRLMVGGYADVSWETGLVLNAESPTQAALDKTRPRIWAYDLAEHLRCGRSTWEVIYQVPEGATIADTTASINAAGTHVSLIELYGTPADPELPDDQISKVVDVDLASGVGTVLVDRDTLHNHVHYSPYNEDWIIFSRGNATTAQKETVWGYHPVHAPAGANIVPQYLADGEVLRLSHVRAAWDSETAIVVNYENPRGLFLGYFDGREPTRLASGRFEHCDISRDGRFAVVDTSTTGTGMCIQVIDTTGAIPLTTVYPNTNRGPAHPRHNHPIFSPTGRYVLFNDPDPANLTTGGMRVGIIDLRAFGYPV